MFAGWNARLKQQVGVALHKAYVPAGEVVLAQGSPSNGLYFLVRYECALEFWILLWNFSVNQK